MEPTSIFLAHFALFIFSVSWKWVKLTRICVVFSRRAVSQAFLDETYIQLNIGYIIILHFCWWVRGKYVLLLISILLSFKAAQIQMIPV